MRDASKQAPRQTPGGAPSADSQPHFSLLSDHTCSLLIAEPNESGRCLSRPEEYALGLLVVLAGCAALAASVTCWVWLRARPKRAVLAPDGIQEAGIIIRDRYRPPVIVASCGIPVRLNFTRDEEDPCSEKVIFPDFGISRSLPAHRTTTVVLTPKGEGEYLFTCAMGMYQGTVVVTGRCGSN